MSKNSYIRIATPVEFDPANQRGFNHTFTENFRSAGGKSGARVMKISPDSFNSNANPLLCALIHGHMTPAQMKLVAGMAP
jgi:hypothetical protein